MAETMKDGPRIPVQIVKLNSVQRLRYVSDCCLALAERELKKGDRAELGSMLALLQVGALCAAKAAPYIHPQLAPRPVSVGDGPQSSLDFAKLSDEELMALERIAAKAQVTVRNQAEERSRPADEYLSDSEGEIKEEGRKPEGESRRSCARFEMTTQQRRSK
ncbi:hypothetical protein LMTR3_07935 [Bradyrhizobium sp. LMTR 3]|nr:hypothetical protein LMTR3_07935 [Bradyrhizobium sp. LMTR 3]